MKIEETIPFRQVTSAGRTGRGPHPSGQSFRVLLEEAVQKPAGKMDNTALQAIVDPREVLQVQSAGPTGLSPAVQLAQRIEGFLDLMDAYRDRLADPGCTLREVKPLLDDMVAAKSRLGDALHAMTDDEPLKPILNSALVTASLEVLRFNRGDYVDA
jgi:hypothetical protein